MTGGGAFGTLAAAETMAEAGIEEPHARAIAAAIRDGRAGLAAKADLDALESRLRQPDCKPVHTFISSFPRRRESLSTDKYI